MNTLHMNRVVLVSTHLCTLKCKLCIQEAPLYKKPYNPSFAELVNYIDAFFEIVGSVDIFEISGGEPLLRKDIFNVIRHISKYENQILKEIRITTNSTLIPDSRLVESAKLFGDKMFFLVDDYGVYSKKTKEVEATLVAADINYRVRDYHDQLHGGGWVDFGDFSTEGSPEEGLEKYRECIFSAELGLSFEITEGEMHPCVISRRCMEKGIVKKNTDEFVKLIDGSETIEKKREKIRSIYALSSLSACRYCNGFLRTSKRFKPAEQLAGKKLRTKNARK
ncbi:MAG: 4Fe-4S cluster-binding domain-containing protein [Candidatus Accumulibacter sp.]|jgi:hypothetical protein|nr:4Fe-4S cluster-binding domain-containing protein [Accumulibacter sp.]